MGCPRPSAPFALLREVGWNSIKLSHYWLKPALLWFPIFSHMCSDFTHFQHLFLTFSTRISHIFNSDFPHFRLGFLTFSTQICNCRPLLSLIVKLLPNCEFIFTFEYFSNIQIQVSYPFYLHTSQDTHQSTFLSFWLCILKSQLENI